VAKWTVSNAHFEAHYCFTSAAVLGCLKAVASHWPAGPGCGCLPACCGCFALSSCLLPMLHVPAFLRHPPTGASAAARQAEFRWQTELRWETGTLFGEPALCGSSYTPLLTMHLLFCLAWCPCREVTATAGTFPCQPVCQWESFVYCWMGCRLLLYVVMLGSSVPACLHCAPVHAFQFRSHCFDGYLVGIDQSAPHACTALLVNLNLVCAQPTAVAVCTCM
jgi:hypothetical protein